MGEGSNIEIAEALGERGRHPGPEHRSHAGRTVEILEAALLASVALTTAWSGYQASRWEGRQAELYAQASATRIEADELMSLAEEQRLLDTSTFNAWIGYKTAGDEKLAALFERRFSPEYRQAFDAWMKTDPLTSPDAPPGPTDMPGYVNPSMAEAGERNREAHRALEEGTAARGRAERYVKITVVLATVLFLIALSQRFRAEGVRIAMLAVAGSMIAYALIMCLRLPRL